MSAHGDTQNPALARARAQARHCLAPTALAGPKGAADLAARLGLPPGAARRLLTVGRIQARLSALHPFAEATAREAGEMPHDAAIGEDGLFADESVLDRAVTLSGAVFAADAIAQAISKEARTALAAWLAPEARRFALDTRATTPLAGHRPLATPETVQADGAFAATCWMATLAHSDAARLALRWSPPVAAHGDAPAGLDPRAAADIYRAALEWLGHPADTPDTATVPDQQEAS